MPVAMVVAEDLLTHGQFPVLLSSEKEHRLSMQASRPSPSTRSAPTPLPAEGDPNRQLCPPSPPLPFSPWSGPPAAASSAPSNTIGLTGLTQCEAQQCHVGASDAALSAASASMQLPTSAFAPPSELIAHQHAALQLQAQHLMPQTSGTSLTQLPSGLPPGLTSDALLQAMFQQSGALGTAPMAGGSGHAFTSGPGESISGLVQPQGVGASVSQFLHSQHNTGTFLDSAVGELANLPSGSPEIGQLAKMHSMLEQVHEQLSSERQDARAWLAQLVASPAVRPFKRPSGIHWRCLQACDALSVQDRKMRFLHLSTMI
jgi:hypothetical protein